MEAVAVTNAADVAAQDARDAVWPADGTCVYHTEQPAPTQWIAVGQGDCPDASGGQWHRLVIGTGTTEAAAIANMRQRCLLRSLGYQWHTTGGAGADAQE
jgi:hypothetical protein